MSATYTMIFNPKCNKTNECVNNDLLT